MLIKILLHFYQYLHQTLYLASQILKKLPLKSIHICYFENSLRNLVFATNSNLLIPIFLQPNGANL